MRRQFCFTLLIEHAVANAKLEVFQVAGVLEDVQRIEDVMASVNRNSSESRDFAICPHSL